MGRCLPRLEPGSATLSVRDTGNVPFTMDTGQPLLGVLTRPGTADPVGGFVGGVGGTGKRLQQPPLCASQPRPGRGSTAASRSSPRRRCRRCRDRCQPPPNQQPVQVATGRVFGAGDIERRHRGFLRHTVTMVPGRAATWPRRPATLTDAACLLPDDITRGPPRVELRQQARHGFDVKRLAHRPGNVGVERPTNMAADLRWRASRVAARGASRVAPRSVAAGAEPQREDLSLRHRRLERSRY
jgi:hypothetical protein